MRAGVLTCTLLAAFTLCADRLLAQPVRGIGDDALTAPRRAIRVQISTTIGDASQRYGEGSPGRREGSLEPLGTDFTTDTLGARQFPSLGAAQQAIRTLTGNTGFTLNLGRTVLTSSVRTQVTPVLLEAGLTNRLQLSVMVPLVTARNEAGLNINGSGALANVSFNPARSGDTSANLTLVNQLSAARGELSTLVASCTANPGVSPSCPAVLATGATVVASTTTFVQAITQLYGTTSTTGSAFVPLAGSAADSVIRTRVSTFRTQFAAFGVTPIPATTVGPARPSAAVTPDGLQRIIRDSTLDLVAAPVSTITRQGIGDVEVAVKLRLFDSFGTRSDTSRFLPTGLHVRQSVAGVFRIGTGTIDEPDHFLDVGTGDGQNDVEVRSFTDIVYGRRFFGSIVARYTVQLADQLTRRITDTPEQVWAPAYRQQLVDRNLGDQLELEVTPRLIMSDFFSMGVQYLFRRKAADTFGGTTVTPPGFGILPVADISTLGLQTSATEHRLGWGLTFSALAAYDRGKAKLPVEVQYFNSRTVAGAGGMVQNLSMHQLQVRWYPSR